jgi:hypothetical protein
MYSFTFFQLSSPSIQCDFLTTIKGNFPSINLQVKAFFVRGAVVDDVSLLRKNLAALATGWYILLPPLQLQLTTHLSDCRT